MQIFYLLISVVTDMFLFSWCTIYLECLYLGKLFTFFCSYVLAPFLILLQPVNAFLQKLQSVTVKKILYFFPDTILIKNCRKDLKCLVSDIFFDILNTRTIDLTHETKISFQSHLCLYLYHFLLTCSTRTIARFALILLARKHLSFIQI